MRWWWGDTKLLKGGFSYSHLIGRSSSPSALRGAPGGGLDEKHRSPGQMWFQPSDSGGGCSHSLPYLLLGALLSTWRETKHFTFYFFLSDILLHFSGLFQNISFSRKRLLPYGETCKRFIYTSTYKNTNLCFRWISVVIRGLKLDDRNNMRRDSTITVLKQGPVSSQLGFTVVHHLQLDLINQPSSNTGTESL